MNEPSIERVGSALREMAGDLVTLRRRAALLERENRELRRELAMLQRAVEQQPTAAASHGAGRGR